MTPKSIHLTSDAEATELLGQRFALILQGQKILLFGDLGVGKTTFLRGLARGLGISSKIKSPTFVGEHWHRSEAGTRMLHIDLYRAEIFAPELLMHLQQVFNDPELTVALEWSEKLPQVIRPKKRVEIHFRDLGGEQRELTFATFPATHSAKSASNL